MCAFSAKFGAEPPDRRALPKGDAASRAMPEVGHAPVALSALSPPPLAAASGVDGTTFSFPNPDESLKLDLPQRCPLIAKLLRPGESIGEMFQRVTGKPLIITVDGLAALGKSTIAKRLAHYYGVEDMSSGSAYRAIAYVAAQQIPSLQQRPWSIRREESRTTHQPSISRDEIESVVSLTRELFERRELRVVHENGDTRIVVAHDGSVRDITKGLLNQEFSAGASIVGEIPEVRELVLPFFRSLGGRGWVVDGRDMGTVVFPDATLKFYFGEEAENEYVTLFSRAYWRVRQKAENGDQSLQIDLPAASGLSAETLEAMSDRDREELWLACLVSREGFAVLERDEADSTRKIAPLRCPEDAVRLSPIVHAPFIEDPESPYYIPMEERFVVNSKGEKVALASERLNGLQVLPEFEAFDRVRLIADAHLEQVLELHIAEHGYPT